MKTKLTKPRFFDFLGDDDQCLDIMFSIQHWGMKQCPQPTCGAEARYHRVKGRACYECAYCGHQIYPMKGTTYENCKSGLRENFMILFEFITSPTGISSLQNHTWYNMSYSTVFRTQRKLREAMGKLLVRKLRGVVEIDETYLSGRKKLVPGSTEHRGIGNKRKGFALVQRGGPRLLFHVPDLTAETLQPIILQHVEKGSVIHHDGNASYGDLKAMGYIPKLVPSKTAPVFTGTRQVNNNKVEGNHMRYKKRMVLGTYNAVSGIWEQTYMDEFSYRQREGGRWLRRNILRAFFEIALGRELPANCPALRAIAKSLDEAPGKRSAPPKTYRKVRRSGPWPAYPIASLLRDRPRGPAWDDDGRLLVVKKKKRKKA